MRSLILAGAFLAALAGAAHAQTVQVAEPTIYLDPVHTATFVPELLGSGNLFGAAAILQTQPPATVNSNNNNVANVALNANGSVLVTPTGLGTATITFTVQSLNSPTTYNEIFPVVVSEVSVSPITILGNP